MNDRTPKDGMNATVCFRSSVTVEMCAAVKLTQGDVVMLCIYDKRKPLKKDSSL